MNAEEMVRKFQVELHQKDGPQVADSEDVIYFLNKAQENFVLDKFSGKKSSSEGFEQSQDLVDDLRVLFVKDSEINALYGLTEAKVYDIEVDSIILPSDYLHLVSSRATVLISDDLGAKGEREDISWTTTTKSYNGTDYDKRIPKSDENYSEEVVPIRLTQSQSIYRELDDPFHKSTHQSPVCDLNKDRLNVYTVPTFIVDAVRLNYIRQPKNIVLADDGSSSQDCELPDPLHQEIVERAVRFFLQYSPQSSEKS